MADEALDALCRLHGPRRHAGLETLYGRFDRPELRASDPVSFVWALESSADREIAAWVASSLSYGRVASILAALRDLDQRWNHQPAALLAQASDAELRNVLRGFQYRWTRAEHLHGLLGGLRALAADGSIPARLAREQVPGPGGLRPAMAALVRDLRAAAPDDPGHLLPDPAGPSACKRLAMGLRWLVRRDHIDPGLWAGQLDPAGLWVPLDTHMFRIARRLGLTRRSIPDGESARRITAAFARIRPDDPVRYDFALTRLGILPKTFFRDSENLLY